MRHDQHDGQCREQRRQHSGVPGHDPAETRGRLQLPDSSFLSRRSPPTERTTDGAVPSDGSGGAASRDVAASGGGRRVGRVAAPLRQSSGGLLARPGGVDRPVVGQVAEEPHSHSRPYSPPSA